MKVKTLERSCTSMKVLCKEELKGLQEGPVLRLQRLINCKKEVWKTACLCWIFFVLQLQDYKVTVVRIVWISCTSCTNYLIITIELFSENKLGNFRKNYFGLIIILNLLSSINLTCGYSYNIVNNDLLIKIVLITFLYNKNGLSEVKNVM